jgi:hypothetical protein
MQSVPKIVLERLKAAPSVGVHPDADVLTAFAERSLPDVERAVVLEHVARCGDCRDVVALALPETAAALPRPLPARTPWLTWPALRWGFVAAGVVAISWFGVLQYSRRAQVATMVAKESAPGGPGAPLAAKTETGVRTDQSERDKLSSTAPSGDSLSATAAGPRVVEPKIPSLRAPEPSLTSSTETGSAPARSLARNTRNRGSIGGPIPPGLKMPLQLQQQNSANANGSSAPAMDTATRAKQHGADIAANKIPTSSETVTVEVQSAATQVDVRDENQSAQLQASAAPQPSSSNPSANPASNEESRVGKAKEATVTSSDTMQLTASAPPVPIAVPRVMEAVTLIPPPRWTITAAGGLQRSFDQGNTWQDVDVNAASAIASYSTALEVAASSKAVKKDKEADRKTLKRIASPLTFRAVAAAGAEVWAGGSGGTLYHSVDAGARWTRVVPVSAGTALSSDIIGLDFPDARHGKITTSTTEIWTTTDGGQTWQKQ